MKKINEAVMEKVYQFVMEYQCTNGKSPSLAKIAKALDFSSNRIAQIFVDQLVKRGRLDKDSDGKIVMCNHNGFPVLTRVHCGDGSFAEEIAGYLNNPSTIFGPGEYCAFKYSGNSMIKAGITDGDIVITRLQDYAENGEVVVVSAGGNFMLKGYFKNGDVVTLKSDNDDCEDILTGDYLIRGVAIGVIKDLTRERGKRNEKL